MKPKSIAILVTIAVSLSSANAGTMYWDGGTSDIPTSGNGASGGGAGNWNGSLITWDSGYGQAHATWNNAGTDTAIFGGSGGTVTLMSSVSVNRLIFDEFTAYTLGGETTGTTHQLSFVGTSPTIVANSNVNIGSSSVASRAVLSGTNGLTVSGLGANPVGGTTVSIASTNAHTLTGGLTLKGGVTFSVSVRNFSGPTNVLDPNNALTFDGGHFSLTGFAGRNIDQTLGNASFNTLGSGSRLFVTTSGSSASTTTKLHVGTITGNNLTSQGAGGLLTGLGSAPIAGTTHAITTTTPPTVASTNTYGTRVIYTVDGGAASGDWTIGTNLGGDPAVYQFNPFSGYTTMADDGSVGDLDTVSGTLALTSDQTQGTLKVTSGSAFNTGGWLLTLQRGGLLSTGNAATTISGLTGATCLTAGSGSNHEMILHPYNSAGTTISAVIGDNPNGTFGDPSDDSQVSLTVNNLANNPLTLSGANTFTGTTTINGTSSLADGKSSVIGLFIANKQTVPTEENPEPSPVTSPFGANDSVTLNGAVIQVTGAGSSNRDIVVTGNSGFYVKGTFAQTLAGVISGTGTFSTDGDFGGSPGGTGNLILSGSNTFTGTVIFRSDSRITLANANAVQNATLDVMGQRILLDLSTNNLAYNIGGIKGNSSVDLGTGGAAKTVTIGANNQSNTYAGAFLGASGLTKTGSGTQTLLAPSTNGNNASGSTIVANGTLKLGSVGSNTQNGTGPSSNGQKTITGLTGTACLSVGQPVSGGSVAPGAVITSIDSFSQVTLSVAHTAAFTTAAPITFGEVSSSVATPVIEVKSGATLDVTTQLSAYPLTSSQTLGGAGTIAGAISSSGKIAPGTGTSADATILAPDLNSSTATLTTGNVTFGATGEYSCTLNGAACDLLAAGALTVDPAAKITFSGTPTAESYVIATYTGAEPTHFATDVSLPVGYALDYTTPGQIKLVGGVVAPPYDQWATAKGLTVSNSAQDLDPDGDGVKNIAEFALGGDPLKGGAADNGPTLAKVQDVAGSPALTLTIATRAGTTFDAGSGPRTAAKDGVNYQIQGGQNLSTWTATITEISPAITTGLPAAPAGYEYHTFRTAGPVSSTSKDFIRAKVEGQ